MISKIENHLPDQAFVLDLRILHQARPGRWMVWQSMQYYVTVPTKLDATPLVVFRSWFWA